MASIHHHGIPLIVWRILATADSIKNLFEEYLVEIEQAESPQDYFTVD